MNYIDALATLRSECWAIQPEILRAMSGMLQTRLQHGSAGIDAATRSAASAAQLRAARQSHRTAVLPLHGTMMQRPGTMLSLFGGTSTMAFGAALASVVNDPGIDGIVIEFDSPGGSCYGSTELADQVYQAGKIKPVVGLVSGVAASAAYWVASQCQALYLTPSSEVGSIGVYSMHEDASAAITKAGIDVTLISAGKFKTEGHPYGPLSFDARAFMQSRVDDYYATFTRSVARGRDMPVDKVRSGMGQGRVYGAQQALAAGMVDGVSSLDAVIRSMASPARLTQAAKLARLGSPRSGMASVVKLRGWLLEQELQALR